MSRIDRHEGARWFRCDFQVHTPRDRNWRGARPLNEGERRQWAANLVRAARQAGLDAIAITDHHDLVMYPYVREAAAAEMDEEGNARSEADQMVVFPGVELTLSLPCQALLIFDADLPLEHLDQLPGSLGYEQAPSADLTTAETVQLGIADLNDVMRRLDAFSYLKGRYILLPHVADGGHRTLLRSGFSQHYRSFVGCGGYTDGPLPSPDSGAGRILDGRDQNYGNKPLAVFQTSDNRHADFRGLGKHSTWVKWSEPSAEALRQSCLARHSRISQRAPRLPALTITRIEVTASIFLGKQNLFLSPQYNVVIGGRGTGKSTLLEYAKWALCAQLPRHLEREQRPDYERRSDALIERTLAEVKGSVRVEVDVRGVTHVVERRTSVEPRIIIKVGDTKFRESDESEVRRLVPVEAYSQKQLSTIGSTADDVLRFLLTPVASDVSTVKDRLVSASDELREAFARLRTQERSVREASALRKERESLDKQKSTLDKQFAGLDPSDAAILRAADGYAAERTARDRWSKETEEVRAAIERALHSLRGWPSPPPEITLPDTAIVASAHRALAEFATRIRGQISEALDAFSSDQSLRDYQTADEKLREHLESARESFKSARERAKAHEDAIKRAEQLRKRMETIEARLSELGDAEGEHGESVADFEVRSKRWYETLREKSAIAERQCEAIETASRGMIRGTARAGSNLSLPLAVLAQVARGSRIRSDRFDGLREYLYRQEDVLEEWSVVLDELRSLLDVRDEDATLRPAPKLHAAGFSDKDLRGLARQLDDESWLRIRLAAPEDDVRFDYRSREGEFIPFTQASAGQRATALMRALLTDEGVPLLVDQPEDDLDNKVIQEIATDIWEAKSKRQLLFASHNANLVVNGDADLVAVFDYEVAGEQTSGVIRALGSIDSEQVRISIAEVMEGGPTAFQLRKQKYGF